MSEADYKYNMGEGYVFFEVLDPEELAYTFKINPGAFGPNWNVSYGEIHLVLSEPPCGCASLTNSDEVEGRIVLLERGECSFVSKVIKAQEAGAVAAIITDQSQDNDELYVSMVDDTTERGPSIPAGFLLGKNG